jgi:hypothetical protein
MSFMTVREPGTTDVITSLAVACVSKHQLVRVLPKPLQLFPLDQNSCKRELEHRQGAAS